jgi:hypothetical protein
VVGRGKQALYQTRFPELHTGKWATVTLWVLQQSAAVRAMRVASCDAFRSPYLHLVQSQCWKLE